MHEAVFLVLLALHLLAATTWVGGVLFFVFAIVPAARAAPAAGIPTAVGRAFRPVAYVALATLIVTGPLLLLLQGFGPRTLVTADFWASAFGTRTREPGATRIVGRAIGVLSVAILLAGLLLTQGL
jgi:hypothetical protein